MRRSIAWRFEGSKEPPDEGTMEILGVGGGEAMATEPTRLLRPPTPNELDLALLRGECKG
jgi:hypothetical protein